MPTNPITNAERRSLEEVTRSLSKTGLDCGRKIGAILKEIYPGSIVLPLYRSAISIEYMLSVATNVPFVEIRASGDPHASGGDLTRAEVVRNILTYNIHGNRFGADFYLIAGINAYLMSIADDEPPIGILTEPVPHPEDDEDVRN